MIKYIDELGNERTMAEVTDTSGLAVQEDLENMNNELTAAIRRISNLGKHVGTFDTFAVLPYNVSAFLPLVPTVNDWANIRIDETQGNSVTRYIINDIANDGTITWQFDIIFGTDATGAMALVPSATEGQIAVFDNDGQVEGADNSVLISDNAGNVMTLGTDGGLHVPAAPNASAVIPGVVRVQQGNGLGFGAGADSNRLQMDLATLSNAGAMSTADKRFFERVSVSVPLDSFVPRLDFVQYFQSVPLGTVTQLEWPLQMASSEPEDGSYQMVQEGTSRAIRVNAIQDWVGVDVLQRSGIIFNAGDRLRVSVFCEQENQILLNSDNSGWRPLQDSVPITPANTLINITHILTQDDVVAINANTPEPSFRIRGNRPNASFRITGINVERPEVQTLPLGLSTLTQWARSAFTNVVPASTSNNSIRLRRNAGGVTSDTDLPFAIGGTDANRRAGIMSGADKQLLDAGGIPPRPTGMGVLVPGANLSGSQQWSGTLNRGWYRVVLRGAGGGSGSGISSPTSTSSSAGGEGGFVDTMFYVPYNNVGVRLFSGSAGANAVASLGNVSGGGGGGGAVINLAQLGILIFATGGGGGGGSSSAGGAGIGGSFGGVNNGGQSGTGFISSGSGWGGGLASSHGLRGGGGGIGGDGGGISIGTVDVAGRHGGNNINDNLGGGTNAGVNGTAQLFSFQ